MWKENLSTLFNHIMDIFADMPPYMAVIIGGVLVLLIIQGSALLIFRRGRLKYWGIETQNRALMEINEKLGMMSEKNLQENPKGGEEPVEGSEGNPEIVNEGTAESIDGDSKETANIKDEIKPCNMGKTGKVYTEEELKEIIRF